MKVVISTIMFLIFIVACSTDKYDQPTLGLYGRIIDSQNGEMIANGGVNGGAVVKIFENQSQQPYINPCFPDGHFENSFMFPGDYRLLAEGPFRIESGNEVNINLKEDMEVDINVIPNVRLKIMDWSRNGQNLSLKVNYEKTFDDLNFTNISLVWSTYPFPNLFSFEGGSVQEVGLENIDPNSGEISLNIADLIQDKSYFVRVAAGTDAPGNYINYSQQLKVD